MSEQKGRHLSVSDNALLRWMERTGAADTAAMKDLLAKSLYRSWMAARSMSQSEFLILVDGLIFVVHQDTVVNVVPDDGRHRHRLTPLARREQQAQQ